MSLFSRLKALPGSARRRARRDGRFSPRLEALEARQLLAPYYVATGGACPGSGTELDPWCSIGVLNTEIAMGTIHAGDIINFRRGHTFVGNVLFDGVGGSPTSPIKIQPYGNTELPIPVINAGAGSGISIRNKAGFDISGLEIMGNYYPEDPKNTSAGNGIEFLSDGCTPVPLDYIRISNVNIHHFGYYDVRPFLCGGNTGSPPIYGVGIYVFARQPAVPPNPVHYRDIRIENNVELHHNETAGLALGDSYSGTPLPPSHEKVYIGHVRAHNQRPRLTQSPDPPSGGSGIVLHGVRDAVVERSVIYQNGRENTDVLGVGFGTHHSDRVLVQYNESHSNRGQVDEEGFVFDSYTTNSLMQYNYSHNNDGAGFMLGGINVPELMVEHNIIRYNVSQNDSRVSGNGGIFFESWTPSHIEVYGNTVYMSPGSSLSPAAIGFRGDPTPPCAPPPCGPTLKIYNNIFYVTHATLPVLRLDAAFAQVSDFVAVRGNDYVNTAGPIAIQWGTTTYTTLAAFRTGTGRERHNYGGGALYVDVGESLNPLLANIGNAGNIMNIDRMWEDELSLFYTLTAASPLAVKTGGLNLFTEFGLQWDPQGYWEAHWPDQFDDKERDPFEINLPTNDDWSFGVSQWPSQP